VLLATQGHMNYSNSKPFSLSAAPDSENVRSFVGNQGHSTQHVSDQFCGRKWKMSISVCTIKCQQNCVKYGRSTRLIYFIRYMKLTPTKLL